MFCIDTKAMRTAWSWAAVGLILFGFYKVHQTILPFVLALMFAYLLYPLVELSQRRLRIRKRLLAVLLPFVTILFLLAGTGFLLRDKIRDEGQKLTVQIKSNDFQTSLANWHVLGYPVGQDFLVGDGPKNIQHELERQLTEMSPQMRSGLGRALRDFSNIFIVPILAFFMLLDGPRISQWIVEMCFQRPSGVSTRTTRRLVESVLNDAHTMILQYMRALVLQCFAVLIAFSLVLSLMGVRYALLLALLAFPLEFIPLIGPLISGLMIIAVCELNQYPHVAWVVAFLVGYRLFQDYILSPHLMKKSVELHPLLIIFGIFAGGDIGGVSGIFLSVPLLALARLVFYEYRKHRLACLEPVPIPQSEQILAS